MAGHIIIPQEIPKEYPIIKFGGYDWLVLEKQDGKALILSETLLGNKQYYNSAFKTKWAECNLRTYLNDQFYNSFNESDKSRILQTKVKNKPNPWKKKSTIGGADTDDFIFILSVEEIIKYLGDSGDLAKRKGWYWVADTSGSGLEFELGDGFGQHLNDQYNNARTAKNESGEAIRWWTRTPATSNKLSSFIEINGVIEVTHSNITQVMGVRPAMWVKI
jgi:hypothetical protein